MNTEDIAAFCLSLPGVREDFKWGHNRVFSVAGNKMFAVLDFLDQHLGFKVDNELFLGFIDRPGIRPAPYLARAHWIYMESAQIPLTEHELKQLLRRSHQLVVRRLPKRQQPGLLLDDEGDVLGDIAPI